MVTTTRLKWYYFLMQSTIISGFKKTPVTLLMLKSNIYKSKLFDIQHFANLVLIDFYDPLRKKLFS